MKRNFENYILNTDLDFTTDNISELLETLYCFDDIILQENKTLKIYRIVHKNINYDFDNWFGFNYIIENIRV